MGGCATRYPGQLDSWLKQLDDNMRVRIAATVGNRPYEIVTASMAAMASWAPSNRRRSAATRSSSCGT